MLLLSAQRTPRWIFTPTISDREKLLRLSADFVLSIGARGLLSVGMLIETGQIRSGD